MFNSLDDAPVLDIREDDGDSVDVDQIRRIISKLEDEVLDSLTNADFENDNAKRYNESYDIDVVSILRDVETSIADTQEEVQNAIDALNELIEEAESVSTYDVDVHFTVKVRIRTNAEDEDEASRVATRYVSESLELRPEVRTCAGFSSVGEVREVGE